MKKSIIALMVIFVFVLGSQFAFAHYENIMKNEMIVPMCIAVGNLKPGITLLPRAFRRNTKEFGRFESF